MFRVAAALLRSRFGGIVRLVLYRDEIASCNARNTVIKARNSFDVAEKDRIGSGNKSVGGCLLI